MLALGVAAVVTGPLVGGIVPATLGLCWPGRRGPTDGRPGLPDRRPAAAARPMLAWIGLGFAVAALVVASVIGF